MKKSVCAGIDLHGNNLMIGIVDQKGRRLKQQKLGCDLNEVDKFLSPWRDQLQSIAVESTYNCTGWWMDCAHLAIPRS